MFDSPASDRFPTTCWSRIAHAGDPSDPEAGAALEQLCRDYWYPLYAFVRRQGYGPDDACDLVQGFLADLLERRDLAGADPERGRFRSFLRKACAHFLAHHRERDRALKRGGGRRPISIDLPAAEGRYGREPAHDLTADRLFERRWALDLLGIVLARLEAEAVESGKSELFARPPADARGGRPVRIVQRRWAWPSGSPRVPSRWRLIVCARATVTCFERKSAVRSPIRAEVDAELCDLINSLAVP